MATITLSRGQVATVDDDDLDFLSQWKWSCFRGGNCTRYYAARRDEDRKVIYMHRAINQTPDGVLTDHRDGDGLNNRRANLRDATPLQNMMNRRGKRNGSSRYKGVWADPGAHNPRAWRAAIRLQGKLKYLGRFKNEDEAGAAYAAAAKHHFGEFANSIPGATV